MKKLKNQNGITLVALVITIIILIILAGIAIQAITNTGLFGRAQEAKTVSEIAREKEQIKISIMTEITKQDDHYTISLAGLSEELSKYNDVAKVIGVNSIPEGATIVSKSNKKFQLRDLFVTTSYAAEEFEYAEVTYKSGRVYYVKLRGGTINGKPEESEEEISYNDEMFTYKYFDAQTYFDENRKSDDYQTLEEFKNYLVANKWKTSEWDSYHCTYEDYLATQNISGYVVTGFSDKAKNDCQNGTIPNTLYIPPKYNDNSEYEDNNGHGEHDVIALDGDIYSNAQYEDNNGYDYGNVYENVNKLFIPSSVVALGAESLSCVTEYGTEIEYSKNPNLKYIEDYTYGPSSGGFSYGNGQKYAIIPDSVEILGVQGCDYWWNYYLLGDNINTLFDVGRSTIYDGETYLQRGNDSIAPYMIAFFKGNIEDLNNSNLFTSVNIFKDYTGDYGDERDNAEEGIDIIYCLGENKMAIQEKSGDKYIWKEVTENEIKNNIKVIHKYEEIEDSVLQDYIDSLNVIINNAKAKFK